MTPHHEVSLALLVVKTGQLGVVCDFYRAIGITLVEEKHGNGPVHYSGRIGDAVLEVYPLPGAMTADTTLRLGFTVGDLERVLRDLQSAVAEEPRDTPLGRRAVVRDPDGRTVELYQRVK